MGNRSELESRRGRMAELGKGLGREKEGEGDGRGEKRREARGGQSQ